MAFNLGDIFVTFKAKTDDLKAGVNQVKTLTGDAQKTVNNTSFKQFSTNASTAFGGVAGAIQGVVTKALILGTTSTLGLGAFIKSAADLQQTSKSFEVLTGNVQIANKLFAQLARYANTTPFEFPQVAKAGQILLGFGIKSSEVYSRIQMLGDIAAATGADFTSLSLVFGQVNATGRLMGQDALQLINNKIPITSILAKRLGKTVVEVKDAMEKGEISTEMFNAALEDTTKKGGFAFHGTDILAQSLNGRLSTLKDTVLEFGRNLIGVKVDPKLGLVIKPGGIFDRFSALVPKISASLSEMGPKVSAGFEWLVAHGEDVKAIVIGIGGAFLFAKAMAIGFGIAAMAADGVLKRNLIAAGLTLLVGILVALQDRFNYIGKSIDFVKHAFEVLSQWAENVKNKFKEIEGFLSGTFGGTIQWFKDRIDDVAGAFQAVIDWVEKHHKGLQNLATFLGLLFGPLLIKLGFQALALGVQMAASAVVAGTAWTIQAARSGAAWTLNFIVMSAKATAHAAVSAVQAAIAGAAWVVQAVRVGAAWLLQFALMSARITIMSALFVAMAIRAGIAWLIALGPVAIAIGVLAALAYVVIRNWNTLKGWFSSMWGWMKGAVFSVTDSIKGAFASAANSIKSVFKGALDWIMARINSVKDAINTAKNAASSVIGAPGKAAKGVGNFLGGLVPHFAQGGIVPGPLNAPTLAVVHGGERVIPTNQRNSGQVNFYGDINIDSESDADYLLQRIDRNLQLESIGGSPIL